MPTMAGSVSVGLLVFDLSFTKVLLVADSRNDWVLPSSTLWDSGDPGALAVSLAGWSGLDIKQVMLDPPIRTRDADGRLIMWYACSGEGRPRGRARFVSPGGRGWEAVEEVLAKWPRLGRTLAEICSDHESESGTKRSL